VEEKEAQQIINALEKINETLSSMDDSLRRIANYRKRGW